MMQNNSFGKNLIRGLGERVHKITHNPYSKVNLNRLKLVYYKHLKPGKVRSHQLFGKPLYFSSGTELVAGLKEIFIDEIYKQSLPANPYIIDCGANIGLSLIYMKELFPDAEILAFEPDERNFELLSKNIELRGYSNIILRKEAVWTENTVLKFSSKGATDSKIDDQGIGAIDVVAVRLKDVISKKIDFLKIDIEGVEHGVLSDISEKLEFVNNLFVEYHGNFLENDQLIELFQILTNAGFHYYIKEAAPVFKTPFIRDEEKRFLFEIQLNIFCFRSINNYTSI